MRSRLTIDSLFAVFTQEQNLQDMANSATSLWEDHIKALPTSKRDLKIAKMLNLATQMPHPQFGAFVHAVSSTADARSKRKKSAVTRPTPAPIPAAVTRETEMQRLARYLNLQGLILGGIMENLELRDEEGERHWLYAQTRLVARMKQADLPALCSDELQKYQHDGCTPAVIKQCVDWLNVGALNAIMAHVFAQLGHAWIQFAEDKKQNKAAPTLTVAQLNDLKPARLLLRTLSLLGLRELATVPANSPLEDALTVTLHAFVPQLEQGIINHHTATALHALFAKYETDGDKAFFDCPFTGVQKQAAQMYCHVVDFVQKQERVWLGVAKELVEEEAFARIERKLAKNPQDGPFLVQRARVLSDYRGDHAQALAVLNSVSEGQRNAAYARERAVVMGKLGRLSEVLQTLDQALAASPWEGNATDFGKLYSMRADARLHAGDTLGAWADARRATHLTPMLPHLPGLNQRVLAALESAWDEALAASHKEGSALRTYWIEITRARGQLLQGKWSEAMATLADEGAHRSAQAQHWRVRITMLAKSLQDFFTEADKHKVTAGDGLPADLAAVLQQRGWSATHAQKLATIQEER